MSQPQLTKQEQRAVDNFKKLNEQANQRNQAKFLQYFPQSKKFDAIRATLSASDLADSEKELEHQKAAFDDLKAQRDAYTKKIYDEQYNVISKPESSMEAPFKTDGQHKAPVPYKSSGGFDIFEEEDDISLDFSKKRSRRSDSRVYQPLMPSMKEIKAGYERLDPSVETIAKAQTNIKGEFTQTVEGLREILHNLKDLFLKISEQQTSLLSDDLDNRPTRELLTVISGGVKELSSQMTHVSDNISAFTLKLSEVVETVQNLAKTIGYQEQIAERKVNVEVRVEASNGDDVDPVWTTNQKEICQQAMDTSVDLPPLENDES